MACIILQLERDQNERSRKQDKFMSMVRHLWSPVPVTMPLCCCVRLSRTTFKIVEIKSTCESYRAQWATDPLDELVVFVYFICYMKLDDARHTSYTPHVHLIYLSVKRFPICFLLICIARLFDLLEQDRWFCTLDETWESSASLGYDRVSGWDVVF